ncbi:murein hydrolase activator EnvC family protein [Gemmiger sp.]
MRKLLLWIVMVAAMVAAILGGTAAFLYSRTGADKLPQEPVQFGGQDLVSNGWSWVIPVLGDKVTKTYESPTNLTVQKLGTFTDTTPALTLPDWVTSADVQITAPDGTVFTATRSDCNTYTYTQNGDYQIIVTAYHQNNGDNPGEAAGWYAYRAAYTMAMNPKVTLSSERAAQGSIVAIQLSGILDGEPSVETDLGTVWFRKTASGYMGYIPVTYNAEGGDHVLHLTCGSLQKDITLTVTRTLYDTVTVPAEEDVGGGEEFRNAIWPLYTTGSSAKLWNGRFEAPSAGAVSIEYGATQMTDGARSGQATGLTYAAADGETVTAPQAGNVVFAGTLTLTGGTVVIDHGCGVKSYLYGLETVGVERGQSVSTGDPLGTAGTAHSLIYELRIGSKSTDPQIALDGNSGLQFREYE